MSEPMIHVEDLTKRYAGHTAVSEVSFTVNRGEIVGLLGKNGAGNNGWRGPQPPDAKPHHYHFELFALDSKLTLGPDATRPDVLKAMEGHILGKGVLVGRFKRPQ
jgi:phosphatidylethanolamine-binding protein (PEBP) family uncharacterized protein